MRWTCLVVLLLGTNLLAAEEAKSPSAAAEPASLGQPVTLRWEHGPISFGSVLNGKIVSWSSPGAKDLLITRCWQGVYVYPSENLSEEELGRGPVRVSGSPAPQTFGFPVDWNKDGVEDIVIWGREGFFYKMRRKGQFPKVWFNSKEPLRDKVTNLVFNIPWENPNHAVQDDLNGYIDPYFYNHANWITYPMDGSGRIHWIIGDWGGNLWWLPDISDGKGEPAYTGTRYTKPKTGWRGYQAKYGTEYVKPAEKICDENVKPFLLGTGVDGGKKFQGGNNRPVLYRNDVTASNDLLVQAGMMRQELHYLKRVGSPDDKKPSFKNMGQVKIDGQVLNDTLFSSFYSMPIVNHTDGWNDLLLSAGTKLAVLKNKRLKQEMPEFTFSHWLSAKNSPAGCKAITEMLTDGQGKRYILDNTGRDWKLHEVKVIDGEVRLVYLPILLEDQNGVFRVEGETDPQGGETWGFHRAAFWNFDRGGRQHLVVGTDKGLLYLLIEEEDSIKDGKFKFRSVGPLKDTKGKVIKVHNRAVAAGIDLSGNGFEDLVVGGVSYQCGIELDPNPGGGFYYLAHEGLDSDGLPLLAPLTPLKTRGHRFPTGMTNSHVGIQGIDIDKDGQKEIILHCQAQSGKLGRVFRKMKEGPGLELTGKTVPDYNIGRHIVDIDGDGQWELIFAGGERGMGYYRKIRF